MRAGSLSSLSPRTGRPDDLRRLARRERRTGEAAGHRKDVVTKAGEVPDASSCTHRVGGCEDDGIDAVVEELAVEQA